MRGLGPFVLGVWCGLLAAPTPAAAQVGAAPLPVEVLLRIKIPAAYAQPRFSPDGRWLAYLVDDNARHVVPVMSPETRRLRVPWMAIGAELRVRELATRREISVTGARGNAWLPSWSPDGTRLAFYADLTGPRPVNVLGVWIWERRTGRLRAVLDPYRGVERPWAAPGATAPMWLPDVETLLVSLGPEATRADSSGPLVRVYEGGASRDSSGVRATSDAWSLEWQRRDLGLLDARTGNVKRLVTGERIAHPRLSPDRRRVAYTVPRGFEASGSQQILYDLFVMDLPDGARRVVARGIRLDYDGAQFSWSPNGRHVAYRKTGSLGDGAVFVVAAAGGEEPRRVAPGTAAPFFGSQPLWRQDSRAVLFARGGELWRALVDSGPEPGLAAAKVVELPTTQLELIPQRGGEFWSPDGGRGVVVGTTDRVTKQAGFVNVDLATGKVDQLVLEAKTYGGYQTPPATSDDGSTLVYVAEDGTHPPDLWRLGGDLRTPRPLTTLSPELGRYRFGTARLVEWIGMDGDTLRGALALPADYDATRRYPLLVRVYGGGTLSDQLNAFGYQRGLIENLHIYTTRGYAVLVADSRVHPGTSMADLVKTVMPGVQKVIDLGIADPARLGVFGHSYGGFSTLSLIVQTPRFRAALMSAGFGNQLGMYGQMLPDGSSFGVTVAERGQGKMGGTPWEYRERYLENSPLLYLDRVRTPLLIVHGEEDTAVPPFLADEVFVGLRRLGKEVIYARYPGEEHWEGSWRYAAQVDYLTRVLAWFDRHLKPTTTAERRP